MRKNIFYCLFAFFGITICLLLAGCDVDGSDDPAVTTNARPWLEEADFMQDPTLHATPDQVIVFDLEPACADNEEPIYSTISYHVPDTTTFSFCIPPDEPHITALKLVTNSGDTVMHNTRGDDCLVVMIPAGQYYMHIIHDGSFIDNPGKKAFLHQPQQARLLGGSLSTSYIPPFDYMAFTGPNGKFVVGDTSGTNALQATATSVDNNSSWNFVAGTASYYTLFSHGSQTTVSWKNAGLTQGVAPTDTQLVVGNPDNDSTIAKARMKITDLGKGQFTLQAYTINVDS